jgi:membrane fusion protein, multidrug efflux system
LPRVLLAPEFRQVDDDRSARTIERRSAIRGPHKVSREVPMDQNITTIERDRSREWTSSAREPPAGRLRRWLRWVLVAAAAAVALGGAAFYCHYYWTAGRFLVSTDDAYLQADNVIISPKVSGYISDVMVQDNQAVQGGQVVARIDDRDYSTALAVAQANVDAQKAGIDNLIQQMA